MLLEIVYTLKGIWHFLDFDTNGWRVLSGTTCENMKQSNYIGADCSATMKSRNLKFSGFVLEAPSFQTVPSLRKCHIPFKDTSYVWPEIEVKWPFHLMALVQQTCQLWIRPERDTYARRRAFVRQTAVDRVRGPYPSRRPYPSIYSSRCPKKEQGFVLYIIGYPCPRL